MPEKELEAIKNALVEWDFNVDLFEISPELPLKQISVFLSDDPQLQVIIYHLSDLLALDPGTQEAAKQMQDKKTDLLQLFIRLPIEVKEETASDISRLLHMINWSTPIGAFGVNESQKLLYYRHVIECMSDGPQPELVVDVVNGMDLYVKQRFEILQIVSSGEKSLLSVLEELKTAGQFEVEFPGYSL